MNRSRLRRHHRATRRAWSGVATLLVAGTVWGCGVRSQSGPVRLDEERVPFGLVAGSTTTTDAATQPEARATVRIFLLASDDLLVGRERQLPAPATPGAALRALRAGPTDEERRAGLTTALPPEVPVQYLGTRDAVARVRLSRAFTGGSVRRQASALAEIVYTLTDLIGIDRVAFVIDEDVVEVPRADGSLTADPVGRADYARFAPQG